MINFELEPMRKVTPKEELVVEIRHLLEGEFLNEVMVDEIMAVAGGLMKLSMAELKALKALVKRLERIK